LIRSGFHVFASKQHLASKHQKKKKKKRASTKDWVPIKGQRKEKTRAKLAKSSHRGASKKKKKKKKRASTKYWVPKN